MWKNEACIILEGVKRNYKKKQDRKKAGKRGLKIQGEMLKRKRKTTERGRELEKGNSKGFQVGRDKKMEWRNERIKEGMRKRKD